MNYKILVKANHKSESTHLQCDLLSCHHSNIKSVKNFQQAYNKHTGCGLSNSNSSATDADAPVLPLPPNAPGSMTLKQFQKTTAQCVALNKQKPPFIIKF
jgi:hypothetical protein